MNKRLTHKDALFALMQDGRWHHMAEMQRVGGWRYGARLHELKNQGWQYEKRSVGNDVFEYRLLIEARQLTF